MTDPINALALGIRPVTTEFAKVPTSTSSHDVAVTSGGSFADALAAAGQQTIDKMNGAEAISIEALQGNAGPREVADAVMAAELSLQTAIAVRDKIVSAYLEISRMAI